MKFSLGWPNASPNRLTHRDAVGFTIWPKSGHAERRQRRVSVSCGLEWNTNNLAM